VIKSELREMKLKIFTDGGAKGNPGPAAIGFLVIDSETGKIIKTFNKKVGINTNNVAEYLAVIEALKFLKEKKFSQADFFLDSQLVVKQLNGFFKIKNAVLRNLIIEIRRLEREIRNKIFYHLIPREENRTADRLVKLLLASEG